MKTFLLRITSPEGDLFCENVYSVSVRGTEGELAIMAGHVPFVTYVLPCECKIELEDGEKVSNMVFSLDTTSTPPSIFPTFSPSSSSILQSQGKT